MTKCPVCEHENRDDETLCQRCGASLEGLADELSTVPVETDPSLETTRVARGTGTLGAQSVLRIEIKGVSEPLVVYPRSAMTIGRRDPATGAQPDIDLTQFAGYRMGVSRRHLAIHLNGDRLDLEDLGSKNGTFLNGQRLAAHRPYPLHDGDELRLGQIVMRVYFD